MLCYVIFSSNIQSGVVIIFLKLHQALLVQLHRMTPGKVHTLTQLFLVFDLWMKLTDTRCILKLDVVTMTLEWL